MVDELKYIVIGTIKTAIQKGGLMISAGEQDELTNLDNWKHVDTEDYIINTMTKFLFEYRLRFMQVEIQVERTTIVGLNIVTDELKRICYHKDS